MEMDVCQDIYLNFFVQFDFSLKSQVDIWAILCNLGMKQQQISVIKTTVTQEMQI